MLHALLIEDAMGQKLAIMEFFLQQPAGIYSINTICGGSVLSHRTAGTLAGEIHDDLQALSGYEFISRERKIHWEPQKYHHNSYMQYLIQISIPYQFVLRTLTHPEDTFATFCDSLFLSHSTALRKLRPLKELLKRFGLKMTATQMRLDGPEVTLRMFYTTYLWLGQHGEGFKSNIREFSCEQDTAQQLCSHFGQFMHPKELTLLLAVHRLRYEQGFSLEELFYPDLTIPDFAEAIDSYCSFITDSVQRRLHAQSLTAIIFLTPLYLDPGDFRGVQLLRYFDTLPLDHPLKCLAKEYEQHFFHTMVNTNPSQYNRLRLWQINLYATLLRFSLFSDKLPLISDSTRYISSVEQPLFDQLRRQQKVFFKKIAKRRHYHWLSSSLNAFVKDCTYALFPNYKDCFQRCFLHVSIVTSPDYYIQQLIHNLLRQFAFVKVSFTTTAEEDSDFLITTFENLLPKGMNKPYFVMDLTQELHCQTQLFHTLWEAYHQKALKQGGIFTAKSPDNP